MKTKDNLDRYLKEDIIRKIYNNELYLAEMIPQNDEYSEVSKRCNKLSRNLINKMQKEEKENFIKYIEQISIKESIEAQFQFELGFKTAIKIILEGLD